MDCIKIFVRILVFVCVCGCHNYNNPIKLPNNEEKYNLTISELNKVYPLIFSQYEGFLGKCPNFIFGEFKVISTFQLNDVIYGEDIDKLYNYPVQALQFKGINKSKYSLDEIEKNLSEQFYSCNVKIVKSSNIKFLLYSDKGLFFGYVEEYKNSVEEGYKLCLTPSPPTARLK
ncbi:MAG: hypothetical protein RQ875_08950 [Vicingaceae bacterium]|nr:hypothetical protein [Vicingaceae bacterium]